MASPSIDSIPASEFSSDIVVSILTAGAVSAMTVEQAACLGLSFAPLPFRVSKGEHDDEDEVQVEDETLMIGSILGYGDGPASGETSVCYDDTLYKGVTKQCYDMALFSKFTGRKVDEAEARAGRDLYDGMHKHTSQVLEDLYGNIELERWKAFDMKCKDILSDIKKNSSVEEDLKRKIRAIAYNRLEDGVKKHLEDTLVISMTGRSYNKKERQSVLDVAWQEKLLRVLCHRSDFVAPSDAGVSGKPYRLTQNQAYILSKLGFLDVKKDDRFSVA